MGNNYLIHMLKFDMLPHRRLNLLNDLAAFVVCFPSYALLMYPKLESLIFGTPKSGARRIEIETSLDSPNIEQEK